MLENILKAKIKRDGPISMHEYMQTCLTHPEFGYYVQKQGVLGKDGDFITSPEISPIFGEMLAIWVFQQWEMLGCPTKMALLEFGPGTGQLMQDIFNTLSAFKQFNCVVDVYFYDTSYVLNVRQLEVKGANTTKTVRALEFLNDLSEPLIVIANEFFDALPVRQYSFKEESFTEVGVGLNEDEAFCCVELLTQEMPEMMEESPQTFEILTALTTALKRLGGAAVIIDYGYWDGVGHTLQAVYKHQKVGVFDSPGEVDLSAHVNYKKMALHCKKAGLHYTYCTQREFLTNLGILLRLHSLLSQSKVTNKDSLINGVNKLIDVAEMGELFKVLTVWTQT